MKQYIKKGEIKLLSSLVHTGETDGIYSHFRRLKIETGDGIERIPVISGNSIRGIFRRHIMRDLIESVGLKVPDISDELYFMLFTGGLLRKGIKQTIPRFSIKEIRELLPPVSLLGTIVGQRMIQGKMLVGIGYPICKETTKYTGVETKTSVWEYLEEVNYTRRNDREDTKNEEEATDKTQMQYFVEVLAAGCKFQHEFVLLNSTPLEIACFERGLELMYQYPYLGGMSGRGHGKYEWTYKIENNFKYVKFLKDNKTEIMAVLRLLSPTLK